MKSRIALSSVLLLLSLTLSNIVTAQTVVSPVPMTRAVVLQEATATPNVNTIPAVNAANPAKPTADSTAAATNTETPDQKKVKLLLKEKFDRSTSAVLKAWSNDPSKQVKPSAEEEPAVTAVVKNVFEDFAVWEFDNPPTFKVNHVVLVESGDKPFGRWKLLTIEGQKVSAKKLAEKPSKEVPKTEAKEEKSEPEKPENKTQVDETERQAKPAAVPSFVAGDKIVLIDPSSLEKKPDVDQQVEREVKGFVRNVVLGNWGSVKTFLAALDEAEANKVYAHLLRSLATVPRKPGAQPARGQQPPKPYLSPEDILRLADAAPSKIRIKTKKDQTKTDNVAAKVTSTAIPAVMTVPAGVTLPPEAIQALQARSGGLANAPNATAATKSAKHDYDHIPALATLIRNSKTAGHDFGAFYKRIKKGTRHFGGDDPIKQLTAADLFMKSGMTEYVAEFLPDLKDETSKTNLPALKIWSRLALAMYSKKRVADWQLKAWKINQWIIGIKDIVKADKDAALSNLISLSSKIDQETGVQWMNESFTQQPERGQTILANLGSKSADMANNAAQNSERSRLDLLRLQNETVEKLIGIAPAQAATWKPALTLLAQNWLKEASTSLTYSQQSSGRPYMEIDMYGNYYWVNSAQRQQMYGGNNRRPRPIKIGDLLEIAPSQSWQDLVETTLHTNLRKTKASLHMRNNEEDKAFPYIEAIAQSDTVMARDLVHEFLRIWTQNHDPNSNKRQRNPYIYSYGFDQKADAIPLTRSKQERNLAELQGWVDRIRKLPIEDIDEQRLADAFTTCHSSAEVFKLERFKDVFGDLNVLKPRTIAAICEKMRANLSSNWRSIRNQEQKQTKRKEPQVQQEVLDGYRTAMKLCVESLSAAPEDWRLHLVKAKLMHDENAYAQTVQKSSEFSDRRDSALEQFALAAKKYESVVENLDINKQSTDVYDFWFYASLGAVDLGQITDKTVPDLKQYAKIRAAMERLSPELSDWHLARFANNLFTRMSPIKPEIKFRYLRGGFQIVGDHPRAWEARNLYDYYKDLVHEIKLVAEIDGEDKVGRDQDFGVYINILHTKEIERESGGFGKYVQNQNAMLYAYNYGRPTENYRDKFNDSVELALGEHFEVQNITFQSAESMKSRPSGKLGWRITPYAYVLLKPKGPEVDRIPSMKIDLDFLDTSGYVVIPVESPALVIDCSSEQSTMRPVADLKVTQTLDERQADDGKLIVEVSASAKGLVPDLEEIIDLEKDEFELVSVDDQGVLPTAFEKDSDAIQILSDRSWTVEYKAKSTDQTVLNYDFADAKIDEAVAKFQRYEDADLVEVERSVQLEKTYQAGSGSFLYWLIPLAFFGLVGAAGLIYAMNQPEQEIVKRFEVPDDINPFTVLTLLKDIKTRNGISNEQGVELQDSIDRIERYYFGDDAGNRPEDLEKLATTWVRQAT